MKRHIYIIFIFIIFFFCQTICARTLEITSFELLPTDLSARINKVLDFNGDPCALIKVSLPERECRFDGGVLKQSYDISEYLVYVSPGTRKLQMKYSGAETLNIDLNALLNGEEIQPSSTYRLTLTGYEEMFVTVPEKPENNTASISNPPQTPAPNPPQAPAPNPAAAPEQSPEKKPSENTALNNVETSNPINVSRTENHNTQTNIDLSEAGNWYERAVNYYNAKKYADAFSLFGKAADAGHADAIAYLGQMYKEGQVYLDLEKARELTEKSASLGSGHAMNNLGKMYFFGECGILQNDDEAMKWFRKSADTGHLGGITNVGYMYSNGHAVKRNLEEAAKWYKKAAEGGYVIAMFNLAGLYEHGSGVPLSIREAKKWYKKAADLGFEPAKKALKEFKN